MHLVVAIWEHVLQGAIENKTYVIDAAVFLFAGEYSMTNHRNMLKDPDSDFSFGVRELRQAKSAQDLGVDSAPLKATLENHGVDPYNTSGSFDRKKNWASIGRR